MRLHISKSKNAESFYISKGYVNDKGGEVPLLLYENSVHLKNFCLNMDHPGMM